MIKLIHQIIGWLSIGLISVTLLSYMAFLGKPQQWYLAYDYIAEQELYESMCKLNSKNLQTCNQLRHSYAWHKFSNRVDMGIYLQIVSTLFAGTWIATTHEIWFRFLLTTVPYIVLWLLPIMSIWWIATGLSLLSQPFNKPRLKRYKFVILSTSFIFFNIFSWTLYYIAKEFVRIN